MYMTEEVENNLEKHKKKLAFSEVICYYMQAL
jgi:hypothetical protein